MMNHRLNHHLQTLNPPEGPHITSTPVLTSPQVNTPNLASTSHLEQRGCILREERCGKGGREWWPPPAVRPRQTLSEPPRTLPQEIVLQVWLIRSS